MEIYLIRHHRPIIEPGICYGQTDVPVEIPHYDDIQKIIAKLPKKINAVICSPLSRCKDVLPLIYKDFVIDERLKELNFGDWEMKKWEDIDQKLLFYWMENYQTVKCPNGESYEDLKERVLDFILDLRFEALKNDKIILYTHSGWIKTAIPILNPKISIDEAMSMKIEYNQVLKYKV